jgi:hypothetical protein
MPTRFFFATDVSALTPTSGTKSAVLPDGTNNSLTANDNQSLLLAANSAANTVDISTLAQTTRQSGRFARFTSGALLAQTVSANTWTINIDTRESNNAADAYLALSIYVWRPSTSAVVGYIYDSTAEIGAEWTNNLATVTYTVSGSAVTAQAGDVVVIEVWYTAAQAMSTSYTNQVRYNTSSQYLETPQDLAFVPTSRYFFYT